MTDMSFPQLITSEVTVKCTEPGAGQNPYYFTGSQVVTCTLLDEEWKFDQGTPVCTALGKCTKTHVEHGIVGEASIPDNIVT